MKPPVVRTVRLIALCTLCSVSIAGAGCGSNENPCTRLKDELLQRIRDRNPDLSTPVEVYDKTYRELIDSIRSRGCSLPDLGQRPLLCFLGDPALACPPGYDCTVVGGAEICSRRF